MAVKKVKGKSNAKKIFRLRIELLHTEVWRVIEVEDCSLEDLHYAFQLAMGWTNSHMHEFEVKRERYSIPPPVDFGFEVEVTDSATVVLSDLFSRKGSKFTYMYDFGDSWEHAVRVESIAKAEEGVRYPRCVDGGRCCPPEDCGGPWGYGELLVALADSSHPEHEHYSEWCGEYDADEFDAAAVTKELQRAFR